MKTDGLLSSPRFRTISNLHKYISDFLLVLNTGVTTLKLVSANYY